MELRQMATAVLFNGDRILMMRKSGSRWHDAEFCSGIGGHLEPNELNNPREACLREIVEESGLQEEDLKHLTLSYILLRIKETEIRQQFVYIGRTDRVDFISSDEGELFWIDKAEVLRLPISISIRKMLEHYFERPTDQVMVGTVTMAIGEEPQVQWTELVDPMVF